MQVGTCGDPAASSDLAEAVCKGTVWVLRGEATPAPAQSSAGPPLLHPRGPPVGRMEHGCSITSGVQESLGAAGQHSDPAPGAGKGDACVHMPHPLCG